MKIFAHSLMHATDLFDYAIAGVSGVLIALSVWRIFRTPTKLTVTRKDTGKSVVINLRAGTQEGAKLTALFD